MTWWKVVIVVVIVLSVAATHSQARYALPTAPPRSRPSPAP